MTSTKEKKSKDGKSKDGKHEKILEMTRERRITRLKSVVDRLMNSWSPQKCQALFTDKELLEVAYRARETFWSQGALIEVTAEDKGVYIVGDIHGQFMDLRAIFHRIGLPPDAKFVFLGDLVDRGPFQLEVVVLLFALKVLYPDHVTIIRGNHESLGVNYGYGFHHECDLRYPKSGLYEEINNTFYTMPFAARIEKSIFCMHGGISEGLNSVVQFDMITRPCDIPDVGILADLTWADPDDSVKKYTENPRGAGHLFGAKQLQAFNQRMGVSLVVRAHQVPLPGYSFFGNRQLVTIFSAPRYNGQFDNDGSVMHVKREKDKLKCSLTIFRMPPRKGVELPQKGPAV